MLENTFFFIKHVWRRKFLSLDWGSKVCIHKAPVIKPDALIAPHCFLHKAIFPSSTPVFWISRFEPNLEWSKPLQSQRKTFLTSITSVWAASRWQLCLCYLICSADRCWCSLSCRKWCYVQTGDGSSCQQLQGHTVWLFARRFINLGNSAREGLLPSPCVCSSRRTAD